MADHESGSWDAHINKMYPGLTLINAEPAIFRIENFLSEEEAEQLIEVGRGRLVRAPVVAATKTVSKVGEGRTSSTAFLDKDIIPWFIAKVAALTNKPVGHMERPQVGHYDRGEWYASHFDAVDMASDVGRAFEANGGQRLVTVLVYLNSIEGPGGRTIFNSIDPGGMERTLEVTPKLGTAIMFFPGKLNGELDKRLLHTAEHAACEKWISVIWIRQRDYHSSS
jgi:prolyl 4-hydroxylase